MFPCVAFSDGRKTVNIWGDWVIFKRLKAERVSIKGMSTKGNIDWIAFLNAKVVEPLAVVGKKIIYYNLIGV